MGAIITEMDAPDAPSRLPEMSLEDSIRLDVYTVEILSETPGLPSVSTDQERAVESADTQTEESTPKKDEQASKTEPLPTPRPAVRAKDTSREGVRLTSVSPRNFFTDGWNSAWHFIFGLFAIKISWIMPLFILYQFLDQSDINMVVDILEFLIGYIVGYVFHYLV